MICETYSKPYAEYGYEGIEYLFQVGKDKNNVVAEVIVQVLPKFAILHYRVFKAVPSTITYLRNAILDICVDFLDKEFDFNRFFYSTSKEGIVNKLIAPFPDDFEVQDTEVVLGEDAVVKTVYFKYKESK